MMPSRIKALLTIVTASICLASPLFAHEGHVHKIMGTVTEHGAAQLKVRTPSGEVLAIVVTDTTTITRGKQKVTKAALQDGIRVVIDIGNGEEPLIARDIQVGATKLDSSH
jgi:hypothetical protein